MVWALAFLVDSGLCFAYRWRPGEQGIRGRDIADDFVTAHFPNQALDGQVAGRDHFRFPAWSQRWASLGWHFRRYGFRSKEDCLSFIPGKVLGAYGFNEGLGHYALAHLFMVPTACTVMSLAFMFSCFNMKPAAATILALSLGIIDRVMMSFPYFADIQYWFISYYTDSWLIALQFAGAMVANMLRRCW